METMTMKRCSRCKQEKPVTEFHKNRRAKDRLNYRCKECDREDRRERRKKNVARNPDEIPVPSEKRCSRCGVTRPSSEFHNDKSQADGKFPYCKSCRKTYTSEYTRRPQVKERMAEYDRQYRAKNRTKVREKNRRWEKANRDKVRERMAEYYQRNKEKVREYARRWKKANRDKARAQVQRRRAQKAGAFTIPHTEEDLRDFWQFLGIDPDKCWYCALDGRDAPREHTDHLIPLSRGGSETVWNKRPACSKCNISKHARVFPAGTGDEEARRIAQEQANLTRLWMAAHNLID